MIKTGIDFVLNSRIEKNINNPEFLKKVFHISELKNKTKLISIFALKEAVMKALEKKTNWLDIEVSYNSPKPSVTLSESIKPKKFKSMGSSISHDGGYTIAQVVIELEN